MTVVPGCTSAFSYPEPAGRDPVPFTVDAGTIALWYLNETTGQDVTDSSGNGYHLVLGNDGSVEIADPARNTAGRFGGCLISNAAVLDEIADGAWHYLAGTYDGTVSSSLSLIDHVSPAALDPAGPYFPAMTRASRPGV